MKLIARVLVCLAIAEASVGGIMVWRRSQRIEPPLPDFGKVDEETAEGLIELRDRARDGDSTAWRSLAEGFLGNGYYAAAEQCYRHASELNPEDLRSAYGHGFCLERTGRTSEAIPVLRQIAENPETDAELSWTCWYQIGRCWLREEKTGEAEEAFRKIPEFSPAVYQLCKVLIRTGRAAESVPLLDEQLELYPNDVKFLQLRGKAATAVDDQQTAALMRDREDRAEYVVEMEYGLKFIGSLSSRLGLGSRLSRALSLKEEGTADEQSAALAGALAIIRRHQFWSYRSVFVAMAELQVETQQNARARATIEEVRRFSQDGPELLLLEGRSLFAEGRKAEAESVWRRAHRMKPDLEILELLLSATEEDTARRLLQAEKLFRLGLAEFSRDHVADSVPYLEKAVELDPEHPGYLYYLADAYRLTGDTDKAKSGFEKCAEKWPEYGRALTRLRMMLK